MVRITTKVGKRGTVVIPAALRERLGLQEGALVIAEERDGGVLLQAAVAMPVEMYTQRRQASFLLSNEIGRAHV